MELHSVLVAGQTAPLLPPIQDGSEGCSSVLTAVSSVLNALSCFQHLPSDPPGGLSTPFPPSGRKPSHLLPLSCLPPLSRIPALSSLLLSSTFLQLPEQRACLQSPPPTQRIHPRTTSREPLTPHFCRFPLGVPGQLLCGSSLCPVFCP